MGYRVESLMSARLFMFPQHVAGRIYFVSNLSGHLSLYAMNYGGSVPEPLLPPDIALQNPELVGGYSYCVYPRLGKILVALDHDGDENYQPMLIPLEGGYPEPAFDNFFADCRVHLGPCDIKKNVVYISAERRDMPLSATYRGDLKTGKLTKLAESEWGYYPAAHNKIHTQALLAESYTAGDNVLFLHTAAGLQLLYSKPLKGRKDAEETALTGITSAEFSPSGKGAVVCCAVYEDTYSLGYIKLSKPGSMKPIRIKGIVHKGAGELDHVQHTVDDRYTLTYNIDGVSWVYEATFDEEDLAMKCQHVIVGRRPLDNGKLEHLDYDKEADLFTLSFSTATSPTQIYTVEGKSRRKVVQHTAEKLLGIPVDHLSAGEDASFVSHDGLRVSARLYMPATALGFTGPRPLVYYIHGGPQGQERPDFAWFSMPLIQYLALKGFAVFVPNVRGSTGYGLSYTKHVDRDWGGKDRLDHVYAMTEVLPMDKRLDLERAAVVGRSYGGYMTLTLAGCDPALWKAACDMFGPYDLLTFFERSPETWKPYWRLTIGDPEKPEERAFMVERSPKTHLHNMTASMLVIQGRNDPRVAAAESEDLVRELQAKGKDIELLVFENEGHDVLKYENRVTCYQAIANFFADHLKP